MTTSRRLAILAVVLVTPATASASGTGGIDGTVVDQQSSQIVSGDKIKVAVACGSVHKGAAVDGGGHFAIDGLPEGACTVTASGAAYATTIVGVTVTASTIATVLVGVTTRAYAEQRRAEEAAMTGRFGGRGMKGGGGGKALKPAGIDFEDPMPAPMPAAPMA
jgi:hypothetical protein